MSYTAFQPAPVKIIVSPPDPKEDLRAWAETVAEMHHTIVLILWRAESFLPGEELEEAYAAWGQANDSDDPFKIIVGCLDPMLSVSAANVTGASPPKTVEVAGLSKVGLSGPKGIQKRNALRRARDLFHGLFWSDPPTKEKQLKASEAAAGHLELGSVALDSLGACAEEIPGWSTACKVGQEGALLFKHLLELRRARDD